MYGNLCGARAASGELRLNTASNFHGGSPCRKSATKLYGMKLRVGLTAGHQKYNYRRPMTAANVN